MKLKLVATTMSLLGLVSCPVLAAQTTAKHKHHHKVMKRQVVTQDYKDMGVMKDEVVCTLTPTTILMTEMTQNTGRSVPNPCMSVDWFKRIQLSGGINLDAGKWGNRNQAYMGENYQRLSLNDVYINIAANINDWTSAFASLSYSNPSTVPDAAGFVAAGSPLNNNFGEYSAAYANNIASATASNVIQLEQAFMTIANFDQSPVFLQLGKGFQDFSRYEIHPITRSMTQVMSETLATSAKLGFVIPMGLHGSVYVFDDPTPKVGSANQTTNYGVTLGFDQINDQLGFDLGVGYLYNLYGVNDVAYAVNNFTNNLGYNTRVGGVAAYGDINSGPFTLGARYTTAVQRFNALDLPRYGSVNPPGGPGAKPWTAGIQAGVGFNDVWGMGIGWGRKQNLYLGYQASSEAVSLNLPSSRWLLGYNIDVWKSTNVGIEWDRDIAYSQSSGGTGTNTNLVSLRVAVQFG